jgi:hypothetical protein
MNWYGIKYKGKPLTFFASCMNDDHVVEFQLCATYVTPTNMWLVNSRDKAKYVIKNNTEWYNADYEHPTNPYIGKNLEIFVIDIIVP